MHRVVIVAALTLLLAAPALAQPAAGAQPPAGLSVTWTRKPWVRCTWRNAPQRGQVVRPTVQCVATRKLKRGKARFVRLNVISDSAAGLRSCDDRRMLQRGSRVTLSCAVLPPAPRQDPNLKWSFSGDWSLITEPVPLAVGRYRLHYECSQRSDWVVTGMTVYAWFAGSQGSLVEGERCPASGERILDIDRENAGDATFYITADGAAWTVVITPEFASN